MGRCGGSPTGSYAIPAAGRTRIEEGDGMDAADLAVRNARVTTLHGSSPDAVKIDALLSAVRSMDMGGPQY